MSPGICVLVTCSSVKRSHTIECKVPEYMELFIYLPIMIAIDYTEENMADLYTWDTSVDCLLVQIIETTTTTKPLVSVIEMYMYLS